MACPALCQELARRGQEVSIYTTNVDGNRLLDVPLKQAVVKEGVEIRYFSGWRYPWEYKSSLPLLFALREKIQTVDVVHIYSMYIFSSTVAAHYCRKYRVPYLLHPHGSLDPYLRRRHALRKWVYERLFEVRNFQHAAAILFNCREEMRLAADWPGLQFRCTDGERVRKKVVVPVGVEDGWLKGPSPTCSQRFKRKFPHLAGRRIVVFFGRLNFKKGLDVLARAFSQVAREREDIHLVLAGPDQGGYGQKVREWLREGGVLEKATFTGSLVGEDRFAVLREAEVFVLPSYTENFGQSVAEAMACAVPVVISDRVNIWPEVQEARAGLVVGCEPQETAQALWALLENPALGREMGERGRRLVEEKLTWKVVGEQMIQLYQNIARGRVGSS